MKRIGVYNVNSYNDTAMFSGNYRYYLVVIDKFTPTNTPMQERNLFIFPIRLQRMNSQESHLMLFGNCPNTAELLGKRSFGR